MPVRILIAVLAVSGWLAIAETRPHGVEGQIVVTSADHKNQHPRALRAEDLKIVDAAITSVTPFERGRDLELFILIDNTANYDFGAKLQELRRFVTSQPAPVSIGVAFIREGTLDVIEQPTRDHERAARALQAPFGSIAANPYCALSSLIDSWKNKSLRREIVMVTSGIDDSATGAICMNAEMTIRDAERAGIVVYALYNPKAGYASEKWSRVDSGMVNLADVSYKTGGEAYFTGHTPTESFEPFLADITEHLANQYLVKFRLTPRPDSGLQTIDVTSKIPDQELMKPERIWVRGPTAANEK